jgi:hypothetical protein
VYGFDPDVKSTPGLDIVVTKVAADGSELWSKRVASPLYDEASSLAADGDGNSVVGGFTFGKIGITAGRLDEPTAAAPAQSDIVLIKYDFAGNQLWLKQWLTTGQERFPKLAVGPSGNVFVTGASSTDLDQDSGNGPGGETDLFVGEWTADGALLWTYRYGSDSWDTAMGVAVSPTGRIVVGAHVQAPLPQFAVLASGGAVVTVLTPTAPE